jgi:hypothetical protein
MPPSFTASASLNSFRRAATVLQFGRDLHGAPVQDIHTILGQIAMSMKDARWECFAPGGSASQWGDDQVRNERLCLAVIEFFSNSTDQAELTPITNLLLLRPARSDALFARQGMGMAQR